MDSISMSSLTCMTLSHGATWARGNGRGFQETEESKDQFGIELKTQTVNSRGRMFLGLCRCLCHVELVRKHKTGSKRQLPRFLRNTVVSCTGSTMKTGISR
jgi:hypothetical protein